MRSLQVAGGPPLSVDLSMFLKRLLTPLGAGLGAQKSTVSRDPSCHGFHPKGVVKAHLVLVCGATEPSSNVTQQGRIVL